MGVVFLGGQGGQLSIPDRVCVVRNWVRACATITNTSAAANATVRWRIEGLDAFRQLGGHRYMCTALVTRGWIVIGTAHRQRRLLSAVTALPHQRGSGRHGQGTDVRRVPSSSSSPPGPGGSLWWAGPLPHGLPRVWVVVEGLIVVLVEVLLPRGGEGEEGEVGGV